MLVDSDLTLEDRVDVPLLIRARLATLLAGAAV